MMKLTVITISYNEKSTIKQTIESVLAQDFTDFEYIIVDGKSTDGTMEIINEFSDKFSLVISEEDSGIFDAMNKGVVHAGGEYVIFMNAGDYFVNNTVLTDVFNLNSEADLIYGDVIFKYSNGILMRRKSPKILNKAYFYIDSLNHQTTFIRKELFEKYGLFDTSLKITSDYDFMLKVIYSKHCSIAYISIPVSVFNLNGVSSHKDFFKLQNKERRICLNRYYSKKELKKYDNIWLFYELFYKKLRYTRFLFLSIISKRYLYGK